MKILQGFISERKCTDYPSHKIVYEWEDILSSELNVTIDIESPLKRKIYWKLEKYGLGNFFLHVVPKTNYFLRFVMTAKSKKLCIINKNIIPIIIDFWLNEDELDFFFEAYKECPFVIVSSAEVMEFLQQRNPPISIEHCPLSIPDNTLKIFQEQRHNKRDIDFCIFGRPNPFFLNMLQKYALENNDFEYATVVGELGGARYYVSNKRGELAIDTGRTSYFEMMGRTKISCYTTPGLDESKRETTHFNQVTPRVMEMLCGGCWVIGHYPDNADTKFYNLKEVVPNVNNYEEFKSCVDYMRNSTPNYDKIESFLNAHTTTKSAVILNSIIKRHHISIKMR